MKIPPRITDPDSLKLGDEVTRMLIGPSGLIIINSFTIRSTPWALPDGNRKLVVQALGVSPPRAPYDYYLNDFMVTSNVYPYSPELEEYFKTLDRRQLYDIQHGMTLTDRGYVELLRSWSMQARIYTYL